MSNFRTIMAVLSLTSVMGACAQAPAPEVGASADSASPEEEVVIGYISAKAGQLDVESLQRLPSRKQIVELYKNFDEYERAGDIATGMKIRLVAYAYNKGPIIWEDVSISDGRHRVKVPKSTVRDMGVICAQVYGHLIANIDHPQIEDGPTYWCENDISDYVDEPWMQGDDGGYGFPLIIEPYGPNNKEKYDDAT